VKPLRGYGAPAALLGTVVLIGLLVTAGIGLNAEKAALWATALKQGIAPDFVIASVQAATDLGGSGPRSMIMVGFAGWLLWKRRPYAALVMAVVPSLAAVTSSLLKEAFGRDRPHVVPHLDFVTNLSYPSGHAVNAAAVLVLAALLLPGTQPRTRLGLAAAGAGLVGISRMLLGVHFPSDVIGGWMLGLAFAMAGATLVKQIEGKK
jgi:membrane-associated phospholipid phosphatase